ncbi:ABC transporter permease [soil metagenome]
MTERDTVEGEGIRSAAPPPPGSDVTAADPVPAAPPAVAPRARGRLGGVSVPEIGALLGVLILLIVFFSLRSQFFLNTNNIVNILQNVAVIGIIACPATLLLISGQFDLSVGSAAGFVGMVMAIAAANPETTAVPFAFGLPIPLAVLMAVGAALLVGLINGFAVTVIGINALITTLATLAIFRGLTKVLGEGQTIRVNGFGELGVARPLFDIPLPVYLFIAVAIAFYLLLRFTVYGRSMYAIGASPMAARLAGIRTKRAIFVGFILSSLAVALASLIRLSQVGGASTNAGLGLELSVVTAVVLGGASLAGGRGTLLGTILAVLIVGVLDNGLIQIDVPSFWIEVAGGLLLLGAVSFDQLRIRLAPTG